MMAYILVQNTVEDYDKWKTVFDENGTNRKSAGSKGGYVLRNVEDDNQITILLEWDTLDNARKFMSSDDLRKTMERAGVTGPPKTTFLVEVDRPTT